MKGTGRLPKGIGHIKFTSSLLVDQLVSFFIETILTGKIASGEKLVENELQRHFGVSRTPLREAFRELEKRGLVTILPRRGTYVKTISREELEQMIPIRAILEGFAMSEAYTKITRSELAAARKSLDKMERYAGRKNYRGYWREHVTFHDTLIGAARNRVLVDILNPLRTKTLWLRFAVHEKEKDLAESLQSHKELMTCFEERRVDAATTGDFARQHVEKFLRRFVGFLTPESNTVG